MSETLAAPVPRPTRLGPWLAGAAYVAMLAAAVGVFLLIRSVGESLPPSEATTALSEGTSPPAPARTNVLLHVLTALAVIVVCGAVLGRVFARLGQAPVIGEVVAGILLGPSLLGRIWPEAQGFLFPTAVTPFLGVLAQLGVILYMFLVGLELNAGRLKSHAHAAVAVSHASIVVPFLLGAALALALFGRYAPAGVPFTSFALFMGAAMAVTAFPVLARILTDRKLARTELGAVALGCAAVDDVTAWCLLAFVVGVAQAAPGAALGVTGMALGFIAFMFVAVRPVAAKLAARYAGAEPTPAVVAGVFAAVLASALATEAIGVHAVFGAFLLGAVMPHDSALAHAFVRKLEDVVTVLLLPAFFAVTGLKTQVGLVSGWDQWLICAAVIAVASAGKFGGTLLAGRLTGLGWRRAACLGALMNTRGLMGLIVLDMGLEMGVISPALFAMMVLMALATTLAAAPLLRLFGAEKEAALPPTRDDQSGGG